jgi:hypothetical protein
MSALASMPNPASATEPPNRAERLFGRDAAAYLGLDVQQQQRARALWAEHLAQMRQLAEQARKLDAARGPAAAKAALCQQSQAAVARSQEQSRGLLAAPQLAKLAQLEQAYALMPIIESAQAAGWMSDTLAVPPRGMPDGQVETPTTWRRAVPVSLPGCPPAASAVHRELQREGADGPLSTVPKGQQPPR